MLLDGRTSLDGYRLTEIKTLDPAIGTSAIPIATEAWIQSQGGGSNVSWHGIDIRPDIPQPALVKSFQIGIDYTAGSRITHKWYNLIITNPPYSLSLEFAKRAIKEADLTILLLRLNWLASAKRSKWLQKNTPSIYVLPNRPSFTGSRTDATDYAWFVWGSERPGVHILNTYTPKERKNIQAYSDALRGKQNDIQ
jgi:hypothetical protein